MSGVLAFVDFFNSVMFSAQHISQICRTCTDCMVNPFYGIHRPANRTLGDVSDRAAETASDSLTDGHSTVSTGSGGKPAALTVIRVVGEDSRLPDFGFETCGFRFTVHQLPP